MRTVFIAVIWMVTSLAVALDFSNMPATHAQDLQLLLEHSAQSLPPALFEPLAGMAAQTAKFPAAAEPGFVKLSGLLGGRGQLPAYGSFSFNGRQLLYRTTPQSEALDMLLSGARAELGNGIYTSPLVLDLDGVGESSQFQPHPHSFDTAHTAFFDMDGDGFDDLTEWLPPNFGILVAAPAAAFPPIITAEHLIGTVGGYRDGFERLAVFDENRDGRIDGDELLLLSCWRDDGDAVPEQGEFFTLLEVGVSALLTTHVGIQGKFVKLDQTEGTMWDWIPSLVTIRPAQGLGWQPFTLEGRLDLLSSPVQGEGEVIQEGVIEQFSWQAMQESGFNLMDSLLAGVGPRGDFFVVTDTAPTPPHLVRVWIIGRTAADVWPYWRFDVPEAALDQILIDPSGRIVFLSAKKNSRFYAIVGLGGGQPVLARVTWNSPDADFRGFWGTPFVQHVSLGNEPKTGEFYLPGYFHNHGARLCDAVARMAVNPGMGRDMDRDGVLDGSAVTLTSVSDPHELLGNRLALEPYDRPFAVLCISPEISVIAVHKTGGKIALLLNRKSGDSWNQTELMETPAEQFPGLVAVSSGGIEDAPRLSLWSSNATGTPGFSQYNLESGLMFVGPQTGDESIVLESPDFGRWLVGGVTNWTTGITRLYSWKTNENTWQQLLRVTEACGALRAAASAPVCAIQTASYLVAATLVSKAGTVRGGNWKEAGDSLTLIYDGPLPVGSATYQWYRNGVTLSGHTDATLHIESLTEDDTGWYVCRMSDDSKSVYESEPVYINVFPLGSLPAATPKTLMLLFILLAAIALQALRRKCRKNNSLADGQGLGITE
ncbi:MAG TPA: hypothetical protein PK967_14600 [Candidatus Hydrogenedentes bacterium]|nr:hypothetical protein [Candidatus Hydrogenedentota bacterium]